MVSKMLGDVTSRYTDSICKHGGYMEKLQNVAIDGEWMRYLLATESGKDFFTRKFERPIKILIRLTL
jgi:hypothetical protein